MRNEAIRRFSYADQSSRFAAASEWLRKLGIKMDSSRLATYARDLEQIDRYFSEGKISELTERNGYAPLMNSLIEATELMDIHEALNKMQPSTNLVARLKKFLGGPIMLVDEKSPSNVARSTGFELLYRMIFCRAPEVEQTEAGTKTRWSLLCAPNDVFAEAGLVPSEFV